MEGGEDLARVDSKILNGDANEKATAVDLTSENLSAGSKVKFCFIWKGGLNLAQRKESCLRVLGKCLDWAVVRRQNVKLPAKSTVPNT